MRTIILAICAVAAKACDLAFATVIVVATLRYMEVIPYAHG